MLKNAPTYFGPVSFEIHSATAMGQITARIRLPDRNPAKAAHVYLKHPDGKRIRGVTVNGRDWPDFSPAGEAVTVPGTGGTVEIVATY